MENYKGTIWATWDAGGAAVPRLHRRLQALPRPPARRVGRPRGRHRGDRRHPQVADALQLEVPGREFLGRPLPRRQPSLGRHGRHRPERPGAARHGGAQPGAVARRHVSRARPLDDRVPPSSTTRRSRRPTRTRRWSADYFRHCEEERKRRRGDVLAPRSAAPAPMFPTRRRWRASLRTLAVWHPRGPHQTEAWRWYLVDADAPGGGQGLPAPLLHPLLRPVGTHRAGRHGELELRPRREPRHHRAPASLQLRDGASAAARATSRITASGCPALISDVTDGQRSENNQRGFYSALAPVHGGRQLDGRCSLQ